MRNTITRTISKNAAAVTLYKDGKISTSVILIPNTIKTADIAERFIRKNVNLDGARLVMVEKIDVVSSLYGMDEADFISKATLVAERSKDTRNMITKTVVGKVGTLLYMTADRKVNEMSVYIPNGAKLDKLMKKSCPASCRPIDIVDIKESTALYVMSEADFIKNARPMKDHQHYIAE